MVELHIERVFDAGRELVWKAFTDPDQVSQWFGPVGYSVARESVDMDVGVGGHQRLIAPQPASRHGDAVPVVTAPRFPAGAVALLKFHSLHARH
jgi:uncharacterized protein YndB with AHSA1/START domain